MKVIETNHDGRIIHKSLPAMARAIIEDLGPEGVLTDYFTTDEALEKFLNSFEKQSEAEQISLLKVFAQDIKFEIVK